LKASTLQFATLVAFFKVFECTGFHSTHCMCANLLVHTDIRRNIRDSDSFFRYSSTFRTNPTSYHPSSASGPPENPPGAFLAQELHPVNHETAQNCTEQHKAAQNSTKPHKAALILAKRYNNCWRAWAVHHPRKLIQSQTL
jgi:hypothetical protein